MFENNMFKTMIEMNKTAFNNSFGAMVALQEQGEQMMNTMMKNSGFMPAEGQNAMDQWVEFYKKGRDDYKKMMDDGFEKAEGFFQGPVKAPSKKK